MYSIEEKHYGLYIVMGNLYAPNEIENYITEKETKLLKFDQGYSLFVDLRYAIPPNEEDAELLRQSQAKSDIGLIRQSIVVHSPVVRQRVNQLIISGPIKDRTRIINSSLSQDWEELAFNWILYGKEPAQQIQELSNSGK